VCQQTCTSSVQWQMETIQALVVLVIALIFMNKAMTEDCEKKFSLTNCTNDRKTCENPSEECVSLNCTDDKSTTKLICFKNYTLFKGCDSSITFNCTQKKTNVKWICSPMETGQNAIKRSSSDTFLVCKHFINPSTIKTTSETVTPLNSFVNTTKNASTKNDLEKD
ncbi:unnamed protein product, partial [Lymnaea stagnalis]